MRIGIVINSAWNIYNFRRGLIESLQKENHQIVAIAPDDGYGQQLEALGCEFQPVAIYRKGKNPLNDLRLVYDLSQIYKKQKLDVVLQFTIKPNIYGSLAAKIAGIPAINNVTGLGTVFIHKGLGSKIAHLLYKFAFRFPKVVFFQNDDDKSLFVQQKLVSPKITDLLPGSGVDLDHFQPGKFQKNKTFTFLVIARVLYDKGIMEYVEAIRLLRKKGISAQFQLVGGIEEVAGLGVPEHEVESWVKEGLVDYIGRVNDVRSYIRNADCVVLPSYREGTPRSLLEAASQGKPLIATDVPGCREVVIEGYNGYLCEVKSGQDLAFKMEKMTKLSVFELKELSKNSRKLAVQRFDQRIIFAKYQHAIHQCTSTPIPQKALKQEPELALS